MSITAKTAPNKRTPPPIEIAAAENLSPFFLLVLDQLGFEVVAVAFTARWNSPVFDFPDIELELERELGDIRASFDSSYFPTGGAWHFFHVATADLGKAMQRLKDALASRGLLETAALFHVESAQELREYWLATARVVKTDTDEEGET